MKKLSLAFVVLISIAIFSTAFAGMAFFASVQVPVPESIKMLFFGIGLVGMSSLAKRYTL